jgi:glycosyltransferase involved in cell wall biosynthesis
MKKTIHIIPTFKQGGVQSGIIYSIHEMVNKVEFKVLVIYDNDKSLVKDLPQAIQEKIIWTGASNLLTGWVSAFFILRKYKPDVIISSLWKSVPVSIFYKIFHPKKKLIGFYHSPSIAHIIARICLKAIIRFQNLAIADSSDTKKFIQQALKIKEVKIVPYIFNLKKFTKNNSQKINQDKIKLVFFGRLHPSKGLERSIRFCKLCIEQHIPVCLDIYGEGDVKTYQDLINNFGISGEIKICGLILPSKVVETMVQYDFLLQLSNFEGMSLSVVEAMSCGLVPIVTPVGEIKNYSKDGVNAIWLDENFDKQLPSLVDKFKKVINDPAYYKQLSEKAQNAFDDYEKYTDAMCDAIHSL